MVKKVLTDVYDYWFGTLAGPDDYPKEKAELWFSAKPEFDEEIRQTFGKYLPAARDTEWDVANLSRMEQVGLVVLLDQFPRNIHRTGGDAFAYDTKALAVARQLLASGGGNFYRAERQFVSLPFMHSENLADQDFCVWFAASEMMAARTPEALEMWRRFFDFAAKHWAIIRKFGRFPHRNAAMGRESTAEEVEFLKAGRGF